MLSIKQGPYWKISFLISAVNFWKCADCISLYCRLAHFRPFAFASLTCFIKMILVHKLQISLCCSLFSVCQVKAKICPLSVNSIWRTVVTIFTTGQPYFNVMILPINHICKQNLSYVAPVSFFLLWQPCLDYDNEGGIASYTGRPPCPQSQTLLMPWKVISCRIEWYNIYIPSPINLLSLSWPFIFFPDPLSFMWITSDSRRHFMYLCKSSFQVWVTPLLEVAC